MSISPALSRRERQIMDIIYRQEQATAADVLAALPDPPSYSSVRALLGILETKGHVTHAKDGLRYIYRPTHARPAAARSAVAQVMQTFFAGSVEQTVAALLSASDVPLTEAQHARLLVLINDAKAKDDTKGDAR